MKRRRNLRKAKFSTKHGLTAKATSTPRVARDPTQSRPVGQETRDTIGMERIAVLHDLTVDLRRMLGLPHGTR